MSDPSEDKKPAVGWKTKEEVNFPPFTVECRGNNLLLGGGGGGSSTGVPNQVILFKVKNNTQVKTDGAIIKKTLVHDTQKKTVLNIKLHPKENIAAFTVGKHCWISRFSKEGIEQLCEFQSTFDEGRDSEQKIGIFSPDGTHLVTGGTDGLRLWAPAEDFTSCMLISKIKFFEKSVKDIHWSSDNVHLVVVGPKEGKVLKLEGEKDVQEVISFKLQNSYEYKACRFSPLGNNHFFTSQNINRKEASISKWSLSSKKELITNRILTKYHHTTFDVSPCGRYLALGSVQGEVVVVSSQNLSKIMELKVHDYCVTDLTFFVDDSKKDVSVISCALDNTLVCTPVKKNVTSGKQLVLLLTIMVLLLALLYQLFLNT